MALTTQQMLVATVTLLLPTFTVAQGDAVIIKVRDEQANYFFHIVLNSSLFLRFHECMCLGHESCTVSHSLEGCINANGCAAQNVTASTNTQSRPKQYYKCSINQMKSKMECRIVGSPPADDLDLVQAFRILTYCSTTCVGLVWKKSTESITFKTKTSDVQFCHGDCICPVIDTTSATDLPIGVIAGIAAGVIVIIVIITIILVVWRRRRTKTKSSGQTPNGAGGREKTVKHPPKPQFIIKDNDSDIGYSTAQLGVPENSNRNANGKKLRDDYDYVSGEEDDGVSDQSPNETRGKTPVVIPPKVKEDYAVVHKTRKHQNPDNDAGLKSDNNIIPEEDYGYSHAQGDHTAQGTNSATVGKSVASVPKGSSVETSDLTQDFGYEYSRASDGYSKVGDGNQPHSSNDDPNTKTVYSRLHEPVRDIQNPYNVDPNTKDVYSKLHEEVRDIKNPYNVLPEPQVASDSNNALPDNTNSENNTKEQKPPKSLPYGKEDYAVVVKTKSTKKPTQSSFELGNDEN